MLKLLVALESAVPDGLKEASVEDLRRDSEVVGMYSDNKVTAFSELTLFLPLKRNPPGDKETFRRSLYQIMTLQWI